ncbi:ScpA family protein [Streptomyces sp. R35]|uniref:Segregation and condensation protein A n=1 Tax=Streptomyces sp. R35 TaxID=3238630 RepID=A0AB39S3Y9_9ACTN
MTSNDVPVPAGGSAGRRRALGRGPGAAPPAEAPAEVLPPSAEPEPPAAEGEALVEDGSSSADREALRPPVPPSGTTAHNADGAAEEPPAAARTEAPAETGAPARTEAPAETGAPAEPEAPAEPDASAGSEAFVEPEAPAGSEASVEPEAPADAGDGVFKVRLSNFEGPFDLLLQLISKHKLDVTEVALSKVTDEFMAHIRAMGPDWDLDQTTEFLVVAATLLDLKAARLLPSAEVEDEGDLALLEARDLLFARLLQYRAYKQIADIFNARLEEEARRYPRTVGLEAHHAELLPEVVISIGAEGFAKLAVKAMQPKPKPQVYVDHIHAPLVSVQEQAGIVVARLRELGEASFRALVEDTDDTLTVVARFLALLELYREKAVALDQEEALGDLMVRWTGGDGDEQPTVTDEFDRPPEEAKDEAKKDAKKEKA